MINWGVLGLGNMGRQFINCFINSIPEVNLVGVASKSNSKLDYLISSDTDDYIKKAIFLAQDKDKLKQLKEKLFDEILSTPLFDSKKFTKNFEQSMLDVVDMQNL